LSFSQEQKKSKEGKEKEGKSKLKKKKKGKEKKGDDEQDARAFPSSFTSIQCHSYRSATEKISMRGKILR
jgi:hypothetical protein